MQLSLFRLFTAAYGVQVAALAVTVCSLSYTVVWYPHTYTVPHVGNVG